MKLQLRNETQTYCSKLKLEKIIFLKKIKNKGLNQNLININKINSLNKLLKIICGKINKYGGSV